MKKILSVLLTLAMMLTVVSAFAEVNSYMMIGAQDAEGNLLVTDEVLVFGIDNESNMCAFGTQDNMVEGTYEYIEVTDEYAVMNVVLSDGTVLLMVYDIENDGFSYVDEAGYVYVLLNMATMLEAA